MKKPSIISIIIGIAILAVAGTVVYRMAPKAQNDTRILEQVKERIKDRKIEKKDEYLKAIGERIKELNDGKDDNDANALTYLGVFYNNLGEKDVALDYYTRALAKDPKNRLALNNTAQLYEDRQMWDRAEETYKKLLDAYPDYTPGYRSLAYLYQYHMADAEPKILKLFEKGLNVTKNSPDLLNWLIHYYQDTGRPEKSVPFQRVIVDQLNAAQKGPLKQQNDNGLKVEVK